MTSSTRSSESASRSSLKRASSTTASGSTLSTSTATSRMAASASSRSMFRVSPRVSGVGDRSAASGSGSHADATVDRNERPGDVAGGVGAQEGDDGRTLLGGSGSPERRRGRRRPASHSSPIASVIPVTIGPGATTLQVMPREPSSRATDRLRPSEAGLRGCVVGLPGTADVRGDRRDVDDAGRTAPASSCGTARRIVWNAPVRSTPMTSSQLSSLIRAIRPSRVMPALFTRSSTGPNASSICVKAASTAALSSTAAWIASAVPPAASIGRDRLGRTRLVLRVADRDTVARRTERDGGRAADAARTAGDERDATDARSRGAPAEQRARPRHPGAEAGEQHEVPGLQPAVLGRLGERERDRRGRRVAVPVDVDDVRSLGMPSRWRAASMIRRLAWWGTNQSTSDASTPRAFERCRGGVDDHPDRAAEDLLAGHAQVVVVGSDRLRPRSACGCRRRGSRAGRWRSRRSRGPRRGCPGPSAAVRSAEHDARRTRRRRGCRAAVLGVHDARQRLGADDEDVVEATPALSIDDPATSA